MKILDRMVLRAFAVPYFPVAVALLAIFRPHLRSDGRVLDLTGYGLVVPVAAVIAGCVTFGEMAKGRELTALSAAGVTLWRIARAPILLSILSVVTLTVIAYTYDGPSAGLVYKSATALSASILGIYFGVISACRYGRRDAAALWLSAMIFVVLYYLTALVLAVYAHQFTFPSVVLALITGAVVVGMRNLNKHEVRRSGF